MNELVGHYRSSGMALFEMAYIDFYYWSVLGVHVNISYRIVSPSFTVSEILPLSQSTCLIVTLRRPSALFQRFKS